jgi:hypothetical protein
MAERNHTVNAEQYLLARAVQEWKLPTWLVDHTERPMDEAEWHG